MKAKELLLLCLFTFISLSTNAEQYQKNERKIKLEKYESEGSVVKDKRSITTHELFAYLNPDSELIFIDLNSIVNTQVSVTNLSTAETIFSDSYSTSEIVLDLAGLLNEGEEYRLEITIGDIVLYGDFIY